VRSPFRWFASLGARLSRAIVGVARTLGQARGAWLNASWTSRKTVRGQLETRGGTVDGSQYFEQWTHVLQGWNYDSYAGATALAESGDMQGIADLSISIMGSPRAGADLRTRALAISGAPIRFDRAPRGRRARTAVKAIDADEDWFYMVSEQEQNQLQKWFWMMGLALGRLDWWEDNPMAATPEAAQTMPKVARIRNGRNVPTLKTWNPRCLRFDWQERVWKVRLDNGEEETIKNGLNGWILWLSTESRPWLNGLWRGLAPMFLLIQFAIRDWRDQSAKFANGVAVFTGPAAHDEDFRVNLVRDWRNSGKNGAVYLPEETELKVFELTAKNWDTFEAQIRLGQTSATITVLGTNMPTEAQPGVGTGANVQSEVRQDIKSGDARAWETFAHENVTRPWALANYLSADVAPWVSVLVEPPQDAAKFATALKEGALALQNLEDLQIPFDRVAAMQALGIPIDETRLGEIRRPKLLAWHVDRQVLTFNQALQALGYDPIPGRDVYYVAPTNGATTPAQSEAA
jgi:hypothetical protein